MPALALGAFLACAASDATAHPAGHLANETFRVETIDGAPVSVEQTLSFSADSTVSGTTGCNTFNTGIRIEGHVLEIGLPRITRRACAPAVMAAERLFLEVLDEVLTYDVVLAENRLILFGAHSTARMTLVRVADGSAAPE